MFFLFRKMPQIPSKNNIMDTKIYFTKSILGSFIGVSFVTRTTTVGTRFLCPTLKFGLFSTARKAI